LLKTFDGVLRIGINFLDAVYQASTVSPQMAMLQDRWESLLHMSGTTILTAFRQQAAIKSRQKKTQALLKTAILRVQGRLHEVTEILRKIPFDESEFKTYLVHLVEIYNKVTPYLVSNSKNMLIQCMRTLLTNSKGLASPEGRVPPEKRCFVEKQIMKTIKILLLAKYDDYTQLENEPSQSSL